jgi:GNAT superfamily N-acetyltransferase
MSEVSDMGTISASRVLTKDGGYMHFQGMPVGVVKLDDIAFLLKGSQVRLADTLDVAEYNSSARSGRLDLGEAMIDYADNSDEDVGYADLSAIFIPLLRTDKAFRRKGVAAKLVSDVSKFAAMHGYEIVYGVGSPLEDDFKYSNKHGLDRAYTRRYIEDAIKEYGDDFSYEATADLALFYRKLGFNVMPLGRQFVFRNVAKSGGITDLDKVFLFNDTTLLDTDEMVLNK